MGFNQEKKVALDDSQPIGLRYISLMHCVSQFSWLTNCGFRNEIRHLYYTCGLKRNVLNTDEIIKNSVNELCRQRNKFLNRLKIFSEIRKDQKRNGKRNPSKNQLKTLFDKSKILNEKAIKN